LGIAVKEGVSLANVLAISMIIMTSVIMSTYLSAELVFLLTDKNFFAVPTDKIGYVLGLLNLAAMPGAIVGAIFAGYVYDICGRRVTLAVSLFLCAILVAVVPWTSPDIIPWLVVLRIAIQICLSFHVANPLAADYI